MTVDPWGIGLILSVIALAWFCIARPKTWLSRTVNRLLYEEEGPRAGD